MAEGYIKLHRKLLNSPTFDNPDMLKVFVWCLLKATYQERDQVVGLQIVHLSPGQFVFGRVKDAEELKMHQSSLYRIIQKLESLGNLNIKSNSKFSVITVANWELYQGDEEMLNSNPNNKRTTDEQQMNTNNKVKNDKNNNTPSPKAPKQIFEPDSKPYQCAKYLDERICERLPEHQPATEKQLQSWSTEFDKVNRLDKKSWRLIGETLEFSQEDDFWKKQILSAGNFRKHFEKMCAKMGGNK